MIDYIVTYLWIGADYVWDWTTYIVQYLQSIG